MAQSPATPSKPKRKPSPRTKTVVKAGGKTSSKTTTKSGGKKRGYPAPPNATGKHLVIVESPTKAKTINRYLGPDYVVMASVGHVRDLPKSAPKGSKRKDHPVPGVDLEHDFHPTYEILPDKRKTVTDLQKAAKQASDVFFATDLDREGEAIAWHLAKALQIDEKTAKRVVFNQITKAAITDAFRDPRGIDLNKVDAQQARRILDRIVGYQVSPLLWKKVAGGLSAGRVQSVATRLVVEREREIDAFMPDEYWKITGVFATDLNAADSLAGQWAKFLGRTQEDTPIVRDQNAWLSDHACLRSELIEYRGEAFKPEERDTARAAAEAVGFVVVDTIQREDDDAKGPAKHLVTYRGHVADAGDRPDFLIRSIETKRTSSRPSAPFITSTLQQAAANRLGFQLKRTMRVAQQLYEGIDLKGARGQTGLITYMRTDSTHLSGDALEMARGFITKNHGDPYLPDKPNFYSSSNKSAQEAHEAIRPTDASITPASIRTALNDEQFKLYDLIWRRFIACQMTPAQWDSTTVLIDAEEGAKEEGAEGPRGQGAKGKDSGASLSSASASAPGPLAPLATLRASGRTLVFDGFYKVMGLPRGDDLILPPLQENQPLAPIELAPTQHFTSPPPRYSEASLQKKLEEEGIGRPSTYAAIIGTIQDRRYVETVTPRDKRLRATDLGMVVTDKLVEGFPKIMDVAYTREMEGQLDRIEEERQDWVQMLRDFYGPFAKNLEHAHESMTHAKAETQPAAYKCEKCGASTMYRFGKNGRFLSCSTYPDCDYAAPIDREGKPQPPELTDVICPEDGLAMIRRKGRFGPFLAAQSYPDVQFIVKLDPKGGHVVLPKTPPLETGIPCPKCEAPLYLRDSKRGLWMSCSKFPKCRGRLAWSAVEEPKQKELEAKWKAHEKENPIPDIRTTSGHPITDDEKYVPRVSGEQENESVHADAELESVG